MAQQRHYYFQRTPVLRYSEEPGLGAHEPGSSEYLRTGVWIAKRADHNVFVSPLEVSAERGMVAKSMHGHENPTTVNLYEASHLARQLMTQHGLADWSFSFDHARRRFGKCDYTHRQITLSKTLTFLNPIEEVRDTLLHEIAHALAPGAHHGPRWRAMCLQIGARPVRCYTDEKVISPPRRPAAYLLGCPACNWWVERRRASRRKYQCRKCRGVVLFRENGANVQRSTFNVQHSSEEKANIQH